MKTKIVIATIALAAGSLAGASAQTMKMYPGARFTNMSPNGRYLIDIASGIAIYDTETDDVNVYGSNYGIGIGNSISDTGIAVGTAEMFTKGVYWENGSWKQLPVGSATNISYIRAEGITPDGKYIVGTMDVRSLTRKAWPMTNPVIWTRNDDGTYGDFEMLPVPDVDITGCTPQQISAAYISEDGKTVLGQIVDRFGLLQYQIIFTKNDAGEWSYKISGDKVQIKENAQWPPYPERPVKPSEADYLTQSEIAEYNAAVKAYNEAMEIASLTGIYPTYPVLADFIKENKEKYETDLANYTSAAGSYNNDLTNYHTAYRNNITGSTFEFNSEVMSGNGQYHAGNLVYVDPTFEGKPEDAPSYLSPMLFGSDIEDGVLTTAPSLSTFTVLNNGDVICASPASEDRVYSRVPYIIKKDGNGEPMLFFDWIKDACPEAYAWIDENCRYDLEANQSSDGIAKEDELLVGSVRMNPTGRCVIAYLANPETGSYDSYYINFDATVGIESIQADATAAAVNVDEAGNIRVHGDVAKVEVYDVAGRLLTTAVGNSVKHEAKGVAIVKVTARDGSVSISKIAIK